ncbi:hypothetical protein ACGFNP_05820 [Nonomuraea sp. NPDC049269]|uniref:hypothetical protein n=1 Tax=Nonomuraea sp. NPDC049269 TaxID=3364349 RepID=UPI00371D1B1F
MHQRAYEGQCTAEENRHTSAKSPIRHPKLTLFALALGTFAIGTGEFGSNGIIQLFASNRTCRSRSRRTRSPRTPSGW